MFARLEKIKLKFQTSSWGKIISRLLFDSLLIILLAFLLTILAETLIPGIVTSRIGWRYLMFYLILNLGAIFLLVEQTDLFLIFKKVLKNKKIIPILGTIVFLIFVGNFWRGTGIGFFLAILSFFMVIGILKMQKEE